MTLPQGCRMPALLSVLIDAVRALGRVGCLAVLSGLVFPVLLGGCASEEVPKVTGQKPITDPISYEVSFAEGQEESASPDEVKRILESA